MKYLQKFNEELTSDNRKILMSLKSLPYNDFMVKLLNMIQVREFDKIKSDIVSQTKAIEDYGAVKNTNVVAERLVPTQSQIGLKESLSWLQNMESIREIIVDGEAKLYNKNRLLVANNKWIIDGHHRWAYVYLLNPKAKIPCININIPDRDPNDILKDIQLTIAATYGDLFTRKTPIEFNLSRMEDHKINEVTPNLILPEHLKTLKLSYGQTDFSKMILREFIVPEKLYEQGITSNDYMEYVIPSNVSNRFDEIEKAEDKFEDEEESFSNPADWVGMIDPTGIADFVQGINHISKGNYFLGAFYILAAFPFAGDLIAKPIIFLIKGKIFRKVLQYLGSALKKWDFQEFARLWFGLEKKAPEAAGLLENIIKHVDQIRNWMATIVTKIGENYGKFTVFKWLFLDDIIGFFKNVLNFRETIGKYLKEISDDQVFSIFASNAVKIKRRIVDNRVDKLNINFSLGPHPVQTALKVKRKPYSGSDFKGVPIDFLTLVPFAMNNLKKIKSAKSEEELIESPPPSLSTVEKPTDKKTEIPQQDIKLPTLGQVLQSPVNQIETPKAVQPKMSKLLTPKDFSDKGQTLSKVTQRK